jgi:hypothetical protein
MLVVLAVCELSAAVHAAMLVVLAVCELSGAFHVAMLVVLAVSELSAALHSLISLSFLKYKILLSTKFFAHKN